MLSLAFSGGDVEKVRKWVTGLGNPEFDLS
jgi:hypothetical protein